ncbi:MAG: S-ribosylhomocysteine lyase [Firmicutes bacterium ADurb.Bin080]|jgi:S-ribosylhomocysteine lyase|nr:MAG: S-ribosylhomocysteine lyase [Firmicutes bacterium ADurb.Bin080]
MDTIPSFTVDHLKMKSGIFVSCKYALSNVILTTFDLRMKRPYHEPVMETGSVHAIEHLAATYLRNDEMWGHKIIYFGPMGCRTGFYLIMLGDLMPEDILPLLERTFDYVSEYQGDIPGATPRECGFFIDMDLEAAKADAAMYYNILIDPKKENLRYPIKKEKSPDAKKGTSTKGKKTGSKSGAKSVKTDTTPLKNKKSETNPGVKKEISDDNSGEEKSQKEPK